MTLNELPEDPQKRSYYPPPAETLLVVTLSVVVAILAGGILIDMGKQSAILMEVLFIIPPVVYLKVKNYPILRSLRWNGISMRQALTAAIIGITMIILMDELDRIIAVFFPMPVEIEDALVDFLIIESFSDFFFLSIGAVFLAAICEESLFRGFIQQSMEAFGNVTKAVLISSFLFAVAHFNPWWMVQILILGVLLGFISWRANSILPTMIIHGINNGLSLWANNSENGGEWGWYLAKNHVSLPVLVAAGVIFFLAMKAFVKQTESTFPEPVIVNETTEH